MRGTEHHLWRGGHSKSGSRVTRWRTRSDSGHAGRLNIERHSAEIILRVVCREFAWTPDNTYFIIQFVLFYYIQASSHLHPLQNLCP